MNSNKIRESFLSFFETKGHNIIPSSSLIPHYNSLLFKPACIVPLQDYFFGHKKKNTPNRPIIYVSMSTNQNIVYGRHIFK